MYIYIHQGYPTDALVSITFLHYIHYSWFYPLFPDIPHIFPRINTFDVGLNQQTSLEGHKLTHPAWFTDVFTPMTSQVFGWSMQLPSGKRLQFAIEHGHRNSWFPHELRFFQFRYVG